MNASRKKDREAIASQFIAIAEQHGAKVERRDEPRSVGYCGAGVHLAFRLNGVGCMLTVNDLHGGDGALISWYNDRPVTAETREVCDFSSHFNNCVASYQSRPHHKATSHGDWDHLLCCLNWGLRCAKQGTAFVETPDS